MASIRTRFTQSGASPTGGLSSSHRPKMWAVDSWILFVGVAVLYWVGSRLAFAVVDATGLDAAFFIPAGLTVGALLRVRRRQWWVVLAAAAGTELVSNVVMGIAFAAASGFALANAVEPLVGAVLALRWSGGPVDLMRRRGVGGFVAGAVVVAPVAGAVLGALTDRWLVGDEFWSTAWQWWLGDALGVLLVGSAVLAWGSGPDRRAPWSLLGVGLLAIVPVTAVVTMGASDLPLEFVTVSLIIVAGGVFGVRMTSLVSLVSATMLVVMLTLADGGPLWPGVDDPMAWTVLKGQLGIAVVAGLVLGAESYERHHQAVAAAANQVQASAAALMRSVFDSIDEAFCVADIVVDEHNQPVDYRFLEVNPQFEAMSGLHDPVGKTAYELVPDLEFAWVETCARVGLGRQTLRFEQGSDVMGRFFDVFAVPVEPMGRFALVFKDETARRAHELALRSSEERFRAMADELPLLVWVHDADGVQEWVNDTFCAYFGVTRHEMTAVRWHDLIHPDDDGDYLRTFQAAVADQQPFHGRVQVRRADGQWRWFESWARVRFDDDGRFVGHLGTSADVTEQVEAEAVARDSARFTRRVMDNLATFVGVLMPDGTVVEVNRPPLQRASLRLEDVVGHKFWESHWFAYDPDVQRRIRDAVAAAAEGETVRFDVEMQMTGGVLVWIDFQLAPLRGGDGTITHLIPSGIDLTERRHAEQQLADALSSERGARMRVEVLERVATNLAAAVTVEDIAEALLVELETSLDLVLATLNVVDRHRIDTYSPADDPEFSFDGDGWLRFDDPLPGPTAISANEAIAFNDRCAIIGRFPKLSDTVDRHRVESLAAVPLPNPGLPESMAMGALLVCSDEPGRFNDDNLELLKSIAGQTGQALERALLHAQVLVAHDREHDIALRLQRALLPDRIAQHDNLAVTARYHAAGALLDVGGDWYDTFQWPDGRIGLMVGDVVGHDLEAAASMGRLRSAMAVMAPLIDPSPAAMLVALDRCARGPDGTPFATAICVIVDPVTGRLTYASAGHPPPLLVRPDETIEWLDQATSPPAGTLAVDHRPEAHLDMAPGSTLLLYSDGLIERRGEILTAGLDRLADAVTTAHRSQNLIDHVLDELSDAQPDDDIVVMTAHWMPLPEALRHAMPAEMSGLVGMRTAVRDWLGRRRIEVSTQEDVQLAISEAVTNAIEHAHRHVGSEATTPDDIVIDLDCIAGTLIVQVRDRGQWRTPVHDRNRGLGTTIMQALSTHFERVSSDDGTIVTLHIPIPD